MDPLDFETLMIDGSLKKEKKEESVMPMEPSNELLELLKKRKENNMKESAMALIAGGIGEALSGGTGGSIAKFGNELAMNRMERGEKAEDLSEKYGLSRSLAEAKAKSGTGTRRYRPISVEDAEGNIVLKNYDTYTGKMADESLGSKGFSPYIGKDPRTGELTRLTKGSSDQELTPLASKGLGKTKFDEKQKDVFRKVKASLEKEPQFKEARKAFSSSQRAVELLQAENPIADAGIKTIFPRMFGEVGNLAYQEQERFAGSPAIQRAWDRLFAKYKAGTLSDEDRSDLLEVASIMGEYDARRINKSIDEQIGSEAFLEDVNRDDLMQYLDVYRPTKIKAGSLTKKAQKRSSKMEKSVITAPNGRKFRRKSNGKYEELK